MRNELAKRQNSGRGLPVQLGIGYTQISPLPVSFEIDQKLDVTLPQKASPDPKSSNPTAWSQEWPDELVNILKA